MHRDKLMKEKKKKKKSKKNKKRGSDKSDSEDEEKKKEKLKKVKLYKSVFIFVHLWFWLISATDLQHVFLCQALEAEDKHKKHIDALMQIDERKRPYASLQEVKAPTEEELEAFRMKRCRSDDPMASFLDK